MSKKHKASKPKSNTNKQIYGRILGIVGNILIWASLLAFFIILPLYHQNGYEMIATNKYKCFMQIGKYSAIILGLFVVVYFATWGMNSAEIKRYKPLFKIDMSVIAFLAISYISYLSSKYRVIGEKEDYFFYEGTLYGVKGWYMGFMTYLILIMMYFVVSRFFLYTNYFWIPVLLVTGFIFMWGNANRFDYTPIEMPLSSSGYVASIGNINWYAGYASVLIPILLGLYLVQKKLWVRGLLAIPVIIFSSAVILNGSDSILLAYAASMFVLFLIALTDLEKLKAFFELCIFFAIQGPVISVIDRLVDEEHGRNYHPEIQEVLINGKISYIILAIFLVIRILLFVRGLMKRPYSEKAGRITRTVFEAAAGLVVLVIFGLIWYNTETDGKLFGINSYLYFDAAWGSHRGATFISARILFQNLPFIRKLIGVGPNVFYYALREVPEAYEISQIAFSGQRLTNAHNEILTLIIDVGLLGTVAFLSICFVSVREFFVRSKKNPYMICFGVSIISYLVNNLVSFQHIVNLPFFFLVIALGAAAVVKEAERA